MRRLRAFGAHHFLKRITPKKVSITQLRARLSHYLRRAQAGETIVITRRGKPIARLVPYAATTEERLAQLQERGLIAWNGQRLREQTPVAQTRGPHTLAELLLADRER